MSHTVSKCLFECALMGLCAYLGAVCQHIRVLILVTAVTAWTCWPDEIVKARGEYFVTHLKSVLTLINTTVLWCHIVAVIADWEPWPGRWVASRDSKGAADNQAAQQVPPCACVFAGQFVYNRQSGEPRAFKQGTGESLSVRSSLGEGNFRVPTSKAMAPGPTPPAPVKLKPLAHTSCTELLASRESVSTQDSTTTRPRARRSKGTVTCGFAMDQMCRLVTAVDRRLSCVVRMCTMAGGESKPDYHTHLHSNQSIPYLQHVGNTIKLISSS